MLAMAAYGLWKQGFYTACWAKSTQGYYNGAPKVENFTLKLRVFNNTKGI